MKPEREAEARREREIERDERRNRKEGIEKMKGKKWNC